MSNDTISDLDYKAVKSLCIKNGIKFAGKTLETLKRELKLKLKVRSKAKPTRSTSKLQPGDKVNFIRYRSTERPSGVLIRLAKGTDGKDYAVIRAGRRRLWKQLKDVKKASR